MNTQELKRIVRILGSVETDKFVFKCGRAYAQADNKLMTCEAALPDCTVNAQKFSQVINRLDKDVTFELKS